jgi:nucleotide-binding universal stress UspA family protein
MPESIVSSSMHVLVALDDSQPGWDALDHALTTFEDADLTVFHVVDPVNSVYGDMEGGYFDESVLENAMESGQDVLDRAAERAEEAGFDEKSVETVLESGRPAREIVEFANENDVDHVVIGSHGRRGVSRVLLGSVAESVTRRSEVPVTIVR